MKDKELIMMSKIWVIFLKVSENIIVGIEYNATVANIMNLSEFIISKPPGRLSINEALLIRTKNIHIFYIHFCFVKNH